MTRRFKITVEGTTYDVTVEEEEGGTAIAPAAPRAEPAPAAPASRPAAPAAAAPAPASAGDGAASGLGDVPSPLAGTVVEVHVKVGDNVNQGPPVVTLEAMKMNTTVTASRTGAVTNVAVQKGVSVAEGQLLLSIE